MNTILENNFKYFFDYLNQPNDSIKPLLIKIHKLNGSVKSFEKAKYMSFMVNEIYVNIK